MKKEIKKVAKKEVTTTDLSKMIDNLAANTQKSIDNLAANTQKSIDNLAANTQKSIEDLAIITQQGFVGMEARMNMRFENIHKELDDFRQETNERFDRIENILFRGHENRIEKLEDKILQIQVLLGKTLA